MTILTNIPNGHQTFLTHALGFATIITGTSKRNYIDGHNPHAL